MAEVLGKQPRPQGNRLTILTNAGGPGVLATDALVANGGELAKLSERTLQKLDEFLPAHWSHGTVGFLVWSFYDLAGDEGQGWDFSPSDPLAAVLSARGAESP